MKREDIIANPKFKRTLQSYGIGTLKNQGGGDVNSPQEAKQIASQSSGQSENQGVRTMSQTVIPSNPSQEKRMHPTPKGQTFVGSRQGGPQEAARTKQASIKHQNPEYFKRQTDRSSNEGVGRGVGQIGASDITKKDNIPARKDVPIQRDFNKRQANVGKDPGRGVGQIGVDNRARVHNFKRNEQAPFQFKQFSKGTMY